MAGYFSNHSQSRFLPNSNNKDNNSSSSSTSTPANMPSITHAHTTSARPRAPSSRHFSTSVSTSSSGDEKPLTKEKLGTNATNGLDPETLHPLRNTWVFWFRQQRTPGNKIINYEEGIKKIASFASVESFWMLWTHLNPPSNVQPTTDYLLFHSGVRRPVWEDPLNLQGGKWIVRLKKGVANRLWEALVMAVIGDQFDECEPSSFGAFGNAPTGASDAPSWRSGGGGAGANGDTTTTMAGSEKGNTGSTETAGKGNEPEICGCTISVRNHEDILTVWNRHGYDSRVNQRIKDTIKRVLDLPPNTVLEYKTNNDSMQDKSSFRQPTGDRTALS